MELRKLRQPKEIFFAKSGEFITVKIPQLPPNQNSHELQSLAQVGVDEGTFEGDTVLENDDDVFGMGMDVVWILEGGLRTD
ncbi:hypothetical protein Leryth_018446, partial [Lithospermum erythrorhizon]